jgi:hypothetical protein
VSKDAGIESRTVATFPLAVCRILDTKPKSYEEREGNQGSVDAVSILRFEKGVGVGGGVTPPTKRLNTSVSPNCFLFKWPMTTYTLASSPFFLLGHSHLSGGN